MNILMTLSGIVGGQEQRLRETLQEIATDPAGNPYLRFTESPHTHFARFVLTDEAKLMFVANYDGGIEDYARELMASAPRPDGLWSSCEGYAGPASFLSFISSNYCKPRGVYVAFPGLTAADITAGAAIRRELESFLDLPDVAAYLTEPGVAPFIERLAGFPDPSPSGSLRTSLRAMSANTVAGLRAWLRPPFLRFAQAFSEQGEAKTFPHVRGGFDIGASNRERELEIQTAPIGENMVQNQMTTITDIRPEKMARLRFALAGTTVLTRFGWPPGEFADVGTLHWFAWAIVDGGKHLVFLSTFDGSWQNYMHDFVNHLIWGLDALYSNTYDYPAAGMKDIYAFTDYILDHQYPPAVFYSAYPTETVANVMRDRQIVSALGLHSRQPAVDEWLARL